MTDLAQQLCTDICAEFEAFRAYPYPDPASPMAKASRGISWGFHPARELLAGLPAKVQAMSGAPWTIGYGQTGKNITPDTPKWSESVARINLEEEVAKRIGDIRRRARLETVTFGAGQLAALASFLFNVGAGAINVKDGLFELKSAPRRPSTLWRKALAGDHQGAAAEFAKWNKAGGVVMAGLTRRREAERKLYLRNV